MRSTPPPELFELTLLGGAPERRYRKLRPEVERLPWDSLDATAYAPEVVAAARRTWTEAAFQEHRTGAACAATLQALIAARAPLDLVAMATRFPLDEMVHVELCARLAALLGGGVRLVHDPRELVLEPDRELPALLQAAELVVHNFCVGEALSIPLLRSSWHAAQHPLIRAVLGRIVKDEAAHGQFGWLFLDWAEDALSAEDRQHLSGVAARAIRGVVERWKSVTPPAPGSPLEGATLGWMEPASYLELSRRSLVQNVMAPLRQRGIDPGPSS
ncbi:MAG: ferritin-like domain-containing protein [Myxococcaceae bacterium]|nr:ferritin-like domain-containing protein [Myxococcaceae bacterium]MCI0672073.1 ferritin-like domain-containing protein [Myxococcaceae bacterium]